MDRRLWHRRGAAFWRGGLPRSGRSQDSTSILSQSIAVPTADELLQPRQRERLGVTLPRASLSVCVGPGRVPALGVRLRLRHFVRATRCVCDTWHPLHIGPGGLRSSQLRESDVFDGNVHIA